MEDGATVPLYYENRIPELQLTNEDLNEDMERLLEEAELDEAQEKKLEREFAREYHLITRDDRLEAVAEDIVEHFTGRGYQGKAMVVCIDKADRGEDVRQGAGALAGRRWPRLLEAVEPDATARSEDAEAAARGATIDYMRETDMAVVVSQAQNEIADMARARARHPPAPQADGRGGPGRPSSRTPTIPSAWSLCAPCG